MERLSGRRASFSDIEGERWGGLKKSAKCSEYWKCSIIYILPYQEEGFVSPWNEEGRYWYCETGCWYEPGARPRYCWWWWLPSGGSKLPGVLFKIIYQYYQYFKWLWLHFHAFKLITICRATGKDQTLVMIPPGQGEGERQRQRQCLRLLQGRGEWLSRL